MSRGKGRGTPCKLVGALLSILNSRSVDEFINPKHHQIVRTPPTITTEGFEKLWQVPGVDKVVGKDAAPSRYQELIIQAIKKVGLKQENNSFELNSANKMISNEEEKIKGFQEERKKLEAQIANLKAQEIASAKKIEFIDRFEVKTLKEEAVALTNEFVELKEVESSLARMLRLPEEDRFLGRCGDGSATYLRNVHG